MPSAEPLKLRKFEFQGNKFVNKVCRHALDWSVLTSLTLIGTPFLNPLWTTLRNEFGPTVLSTAEDTPPSDTPRKYHLALKEIRTDFACFSLLKFVKATLAPNTLEALFLHRLSEGRESTSELNRELHGAIMYHSGSLQKLYLEGSYQLKPNFDFPQYFPLESELLSYLSSGSMVNLRELSLALDNNNLNGLYARFKNIPELRALQIQYVYNYPGSRAVCYAGVVLDKILELITRHPEKMKRLRYIGSMGKCYEIGEEPVPEGRRRTGEVEGNVVTEAQPDTGDGNPVSEGEGGNGGHIDFSPRRHTLPAGSGLRRWLAGGGDNAPGGDTGPRGLEEAELWAPALTVEYGNVLEGGSTSGAARLATLSEIAAHGGQDGIDNPDRQDHDPQQQQQQQQGDGDGHQQQEQQEGDHGGNNSEVHSSHKWISSSHNLHEKPVDKRDIVYKLRSIQPGDKPTVFKAWAGELD
ncbi:uncharacterized protein C8A04DRAFT_29757 [Dichotomopilus funicola]|uniref:Uncharacterized protein n=1 Tax=Dichotomopilus funicola TaxID=1934379 RepID=A0AAN6ZLA1_9PEZI|nr:hypothetical protein C8A04DRAFT_29757 [Dichotomopilus funicola]